MHASILTWVVILLMYEKCTSQMKNCCGGGIPYHEKPTISSAECNITPCTNGAYLKLNIGAIA